MVVLKPTLEGERMLSCTKCGMIGIGSPFRERTSFYTRGESYISHCRRCACAQNAAYRKTLSAEKISARNVRRRDRKREVAQDPVKRERERQYQREYYRRRIKGNPDIRARKAESQHRYYQRNKERILELAKIDRRLRAERRGKKLKVVELENARKCRSGILLPLGPPLNWVESLIDRKTVQLLADYSTQSTLSKEEKAKEAREAATHLIALELHTDARRLYAWRYEQKSVDLVTLEKMLSHTNYTLDEIYSDYARGYTVTLAEDCSYTITLDVSHWTPTPDDDLHTTV